MIFLPSINGSKPVPKMIKQLPLFIFLLFSSLSSSVAFAFPEMIRHGYPNCTSCHVSPSGGGVLTSYGRELSSEILSTWSKEGESDFLYGHPKLPEWLSAGGDIRAIEIYRNTPQVYSERFLLMQADVEAAATYQKWTFDLTPGLYMQTPEVRRFYAVYRPNDAFSLRAGKFRAAYGLMEPDHTTPIQRGLGWDEGTESYNIEGAWLGEHFNTYLTANFGPLDSSLISGPAKEKGADLRVGLPFADRYQVGVSYFHGISQLATRDVAGPFGILGFTHHFFLLTEIDYQSLYSSQLMPDTKGWVTWDKLDYEFIQGLHGYLSYGLTRTNFGGPSTTFYGIGSQFFPRPHVELDLLWQFRSVPQFPGATIDYATFLMHYYL